MSPESFALQRTWPRRSTPRCG